MDKQRSKELQKQNSREKTEKQRSRETEIKKQKCLERKNNTPPQNNNP